MSQTLLVLAAFIIALGIGIFIGKLLFSAKSQSEKTGLERTLRVINANNLRWAGSYKNTNQRDSLYPLILNHKNYKIAVLNCTYGTNMNPVYSPNRVNMIDTIELKTDIDKAKLQKPDLILAVMHWGVEYQLDANTEQKQIADFLIRITWAS
jgi:poly-gamma-glutamate synthesis protein (capsule biosynthesis protein)